MLLWRYNMQPGRERHENDADSKEAPPPNRPLRAGAQYGIMPVMIQNIIFDMGNVLVGYDADYIVSHFTDDPADHALLLAAIFRSPQWAMADANAITEDDFYALLPGRLPERLLPAGQRAFREWHLYNQRIPAAETLVDDLKKAGYRLYLLSNASLRWDVYWQDYHALSALDGHIVSSHVNAVKPDAAIYQTLFDTYDLTPAECYFVDDLPANIEGGRRMGMDGFVFDRFQYDELRDDMRAKGVRI